MGVCLQTTPMLRSRKWIIADIHTVETQPTGIFGVPLAESIRYANVAISLQNDEGQSFIYGYVPIVVAKCGVFLKEKGELPSTGARIYQLTLQKPPMLKASFA